eukprot:scaffold8014_cov27-Tisochrysis_lutea.AAC.1
MFVSENPAAFKVEDADGGATIGHVTPFDARDRRVGSWAWSARPWVMTMASICGSAAASP